MNRIQTRSPFLVKHTETDLTSIIIELYIYTGTQGTSQPASPNYTLEIEAYNDLAVTDLSEFIQDFIDYAHDGTYVSQMVWVDYVITPFVLGAEQTALAEVNLEGFYGFKYHEEGAQNTSTADATNKILISNTTIFRPAGTTVNIPVIRDSNYDVIYEGRNGEVILSEAITPSVVSSTRIKYLNDSGTAGLDTFKDRVIADGGTYEESACISYLLCSDFSNLSRISVDGTIIKIKDLEHTKYDSYKLTFVNKFGALQDLWFTGKSSKQSKIEKNATYRRNVLIGDTYDVSTHNQAQQVKNGTQSMQLSTGFLTEDYNEVFRQLNYSKHVWIEIDSVTLPVILVDSTFKYKTRLNDKLISYQTNLEFAFNEINNIR